jgi:hypothetical protein
MILAAAGMLLSGALEKDVDTIVVPASRTHYGPSASRSDENEKFELRRCHTHCGYLCRGLPETCVLVVLRVPWQSVLPAMNVLVVVDMLRGRLEKECAMNRRANENGSSYCCRIGVRFYRDRFKRDRCELWACFRHRKGCHCTVTARTV